MLINNVRDHDICVDGVIIKAQESGDVSADKKSNEIKNLLAMGWITIDGAKTK